MSNRNPSHRDPEYEQPDNDEDENQQEDSEGLNDESGIQQEDPEQDNRSGELVQEEAEEIPQDKDGLIEYLRNKLDKTHDTINEAFDVLQREKELTGNLIAEFEVKKKELAKIQQRENRPIKEKVHEKIEQTLEEAIIEKVKAENLRNDTKAMVMEREMMIEELDWSLRNLHIENNQKGRELEHLQNRVVEYDNMIENLNAHKDQLEQEGEQKSEEIKQLLKERDDMRGVMYKLSDVKNVLNRLLGNPQLLFAKSGNFNDLERAHGPASGQQETTPKNIQVHVNKPNYMVNEDDFWYANPTKEAYAKDYGGRDYNYNQQYYYNMKGQNEQMAENVQIEAHQIIHNEQDIGFNDDSQIGKTLPPVNLKGQNNKRGIPSNSDLKGSR